MFTKHDFINIAKLYLFTCKLFKETRQQKTNKKKQEGQDSPESLIWTQMSLVCIRPLIFVLL